ELGRAAGRAARRGRDPRRGGAQGRPPREPQRGDARLAGADEAGGGGHQPGSRQLVRAPARGRAALLLRGRAGGVPHRPERGRGGGGGRRRELPGVDGADGGPRVLSGPPSGRAYWSVRTSPAAVGSP